VTAEPFAGLPPRPDPATGIPRPPAAPLESDDPPAEPARCRIPAGASPPEGEGPVLESYEQSRTERLKMGILFGAIVMVPLTIRDGGLGWMGIWQFWLAVALGPLFCLFQPRDRLAAGAEWLRVGRTHLRVYELVSVKVTGTASGVSWSLDLKDAKGADVALSLFLIQRNPRLWDLVYNGIRYSVRSGAKTNKRAIKMLRLS
jgi:hypothetical protein